MPRDGSKTKTAIMDAAELLILDQGFAGTPIDDVIGAAGVTKGAFFHHFDTKQGLAHALIDRFTERDEQQLRTKMERAERLHKDPLQQLLIFVSLLQEDAEILTHPTPGCLIGSYVYEAGLFDEDILQVMNDAMMVWRSAIESKLEAIAKIYPPRVDVNFAALADMLTVIIEGAYVFAKTIKDPSVVADQLGQYRDYLDLLFARPA